MVLKSQHGTEGMIPPYPSGKSFYFVFKSHHILNYIMSGEYALKSRKLQLGNLLYFEQELMDKLYLFSNSSYLRLQENSIENHVS